MSAPQDNHGGKGFWVQLFRAEVITQVVWAIALAAVAITAIIVFGTRS